MPDEQPNLLASWIIEVKEELRDARDLRLDFEKFKTEVKTRNKVIWLLAGFFIASLGVFIPVIIKLIKLISIIQSL